MCARCSGDAVLHSDVLAFSGLADRLSSGGVLAEAQRLMADADDEETAGQLLDALRDLVRHAHAFPPVAAVPVPSGRELALEQVLSARDAVFGPTEDVPAEEAAGRTAAGMLTPYPPGIPAGLPGERLTRPVLRYLTEGVAAGMNVPDAADSTLRTVRVTVPEGRRNAAKQD